jgi:hypothetical protein
VYRGVNSGNYSYLSTTSVTHFLDAAATPGAIYYYVVAAEYFSNIYPSGQGPNSTEIIGLIPTPPTAPTAVVLTAGNRSVLLSWNPPASTGGKVIFEYQVFRRSASGTYSFVGITSGLSFNDTGLSGGTTYYYVVAAVNSAGKGAYSLEDSTTPFGPSTLVQTVTVTTSTTQTVTTSITSISTDTITVAGSTATVTELSTVVETKSTPAWEAFSILGIIFLSSSFVLIRRRFR